MKIHFLAAGQVKSTHHQGIIVLHLSLTAFQLDADVLAILA